MNTSDLQQEIERLIQSLGKNYKIIGSHNSGLVRKIEAILKVQLPASYSWFLEKYGLLLFPGSFLLGGGLGEIPTCVDRTKSWQEHGLPWEYVVVEDEGDEIVYCLDTSRLVDGECPIVAWDQESNSSYDFLPNYYELFLLRLKESIEFINSSPSS